MLQHSVAFAADAPGSVTLRYVIADPGTWLYFDPVRPQPRIAGQSTDWAACGTGAAFPGACSFVFQAPPAASACPGQDRWKYGLQALPGHLGRDAVTARSRYAAAQIDYLEGALDSSADKGAFYPILDKSCAAMLQGPFRLQRGRAFAAYEREVLAPQRPAGSSSCPTAPTMWPACCRPWRPGPCCSRPIPDVGNAMAATAVQPLDRKAGHRGMPEP
jgi:hypothetical protein